LLLVQICSVPAVIRPMVSVRAIARFMIKKVKSKVEGTLLTLLQAQAGPGATNSEGRSAASGSLDLAEIVQLCFPRRRAGLGSNFGLVVVPGRWRKRAGLGNGFGLIVVPGGWI